MVRRILLAFGVSLLIGIAIGFFTSEDKYFIMLPKEPKREITYENYLHLKCNINGGYSQYIQEVESYNAMNAMLFGLTAFGLFSVFLSFAKKKSEFK